MADDFRAFYRDILQKELGGKLPEALLQRYEPVSCLAHEDLRQLYLVTRRTDGASAILRVTAEGGEQDAAAEYETLVRLDHPGIPGALDLFSDGERQYLLREYAPGQTLARYVTAYGPLGQREIIDIALALCNILDYLHRQTPPVIHRDIKPENIIINSDGGIALIDFGIARTYRDHATSDTVAIGTRPYMAPEQFGGAQTDARTDLYSLGVVLIFMGTQTPDKTNLRHRYPYKALLPVIERCIQIDPDRRYRSDAALRGALLRVRRGGYRRALGIAGAAGLALAIAAGCYGWSAHRGYRAGYDAGERTGLASGSESGYQLGLTEGYAAGYDEGILQIDRARYLRQDDSAPQYFAQQQGDRGNTGPNLVNHGLCVTDGTHIYFCADDRIWRMDMQGATPTVFCDAGGENLNLHGESLYFSSRDGVYRVRLEDGTPEVINPAYLGDLFIVDDTIWGTNSADLLHLYRMDLDGGNLTQANEIAQMYYLNVEPDRIYYASGLDGNHIYSADLQGGDPVLLDAADGHWINVIDDYLFYTQYGSETALIRMRTDGSDRVVFSGISPAYTNITPYGIFFASGFDSNRLYWMPLSGVGSVKLVDARVANINVVGEWVFYQNRDEGNRLYRMHVDGSQIQPAVPE